MSESNTLVPDGAADPPPRFARRRESASPPIWWCYGRVECSFPFSLLLRRRNTRSAHSAGDRASGRGNCRGFEILLFRGPENSNPLRYLIFRCWRQHRKLEPFALFDFSGPRKLEPFARIPLPSAWKFEVEPICSHFGVLIQKAAIILGCVVVSLSCYCNCHVDDRDARRSLVGLPNLHCPSAQQCCTAS